jgi:hypothetical protein
MREYWFVVLMRRLPGPNWITGALTAIGLALLFLWLFEVLAPGAPSDPRFVAGIGTSLFFAFINAYAIIVGAYVIRRSQTILDHLREVLDLDDEAFNAARQSIAAAPLMVHVRITVLALALGIAHNILLHGSAAEMVTKAFSSRFDIGGTLGAMLTWFVVMSLAWVFVRNAHIYSRLGREHIQIDLLHTHRLVPFGTLAVLPALALMGTQILYPLLSLGGTFNAPAILPGFLITLIAVIYLLIISTWSLHRRLALAKSNAIEQSNANISSWQSETDINQLAQLQPYLHYRQYLATLSEWPFNLSTLGRWALYLTIPPLTWIAAALMENLIDRIVS